MTLHPFLPVRFTACGAGLASLLVGCGNKPTDTGDTGYTDVCRGSTESLPDDLHVVGLTATSNGTVWALGDGGGWWRDSGAGWASVGSLRDGGSVNGFGSTFATGDTVWAVGQDDLSWTVGTSWAAVDLGLDDESVQDAAGLDASTVAVVTNTFCDDCETVDVRLRVGDASGFDLTDLGWIPDAVLAVGGDGAGRALAVSGDVGWLWDNGVWTAVTLPAVAYWTDVIGFDGQWVLAGEDGTLLRGSDGDWRAETLEVMQPRLAGTGMDDLWVLGVDATNTSAALHDDGTGWVVVPLPDGAWGRAVAPAVGELVTGGMGPAIARGGTSGLVQEWSTAHLIGDGAAWSAPDGTIFLAESDGFLAVDEGGAWTTVGAIDGGQARDAAGCGDLRWALAEEGQVATWDGATLTQDAGLSEDNTWYWTIAATADCTVVAGGFHMSDDETSTAVLRALVNGAWQELPAPPGRWLNALLAASTTDLVVATSDGLYVGDGTTWSAVAGAADVTDLARTDDGRVWVAMDGDARGLAELVDGALVVVDGAPDRIDTLLPHGDAVITAGWEGESTAIRRWDGTWTDLTSVDGSLGALGIEGEDTLLVLTWDMAERVCL